jgi:hypothetical protein
VQVKHAGAQERAGYQSGIVGETYSEGGGREGLGRGIRVRDAQSERSVSRGRLKRMRHSNDYNELQVEV